MEKAKQRRADSINSINKSLFYVLGEVTGFGLLDAMAIMFSLLYMNQNICLVYLMILR